MMTPGSFSDASHEPAHGVTVEALKKALDQVRDAVLLIAPYIEGEAPQVLYANARMAVMGGLFSGNDTLNLRSLLESSADFEALQISFKAAAKQGGASWAGNLKNLLSQKSQRVEWRIRGVQDEHGRLQYYVVTLLTEPSPVVASPLAPVNVPDRDDSRRLRNDNLANLSLGILHDLNNLLGIIMANLSAKLHHKGDGGGEFIREALVAAQQAKKYTSQVMRSAKGMPVDLVPTDIENLAREAAHIARSGSAVEVVFEVDRSLRWAVVDPAEMSQVFQNLMINGIEAMDRSGFMNLLLRNVEIPEGSKELPAGSYVEVVIIDRGVGMTTEQLEKARGGLFTTKPQGNGIGLMTCARIIKNHQGALKISSTKGVGTEVTVMLPATTVTTTLVQRQNDVQGAKTLIPGRGMILVVEDETGLRQINLNVLKKCGYQCFEVTNGQDAVDLYRQLKREDREVDLVLMDLTLQGGMSGEDAMRAIKAQSPSAKVVATSGSLVDESLDQYLVKGFCDILPKPYEAHELSMVVYRNIFGNAL